MLYAHPNYLYRMTTLSAVAGLADVVGKFIERTIRFIYLTRRSFLDNETIKEALVPLVVRMVEDPVPNVRFVSLFKQSFDEDFFF
jgi:hypothetical protein